MQTTAIGTVANSLPENEVILLTLLISKGYILFAELRNKLRKHWILSFFGEILVAGSVCTVGRGSFRVHAFTEGQNLPSACINL